MILNQVNSLEQLDQICHRCCFEINYAHKTAAEEKVSEFIKNLMQNIHQLQPLLSGQSSETTIFVMCEYMAKLVKELPLQTLTTIVSVLLRCIKNWYQPQTKQILRGWNALQTHTINSIWNLMGESVRRVIMIVVPQKSQLFQEMVFQNQLGLIFWRHITKILGTIDTELGFSTTQNIILYYQDQVMPKIIQYMNPYFSSLTQTIKMNQLVILQDNLVLSGNVDSQSKLKRLLSFSDQELLIAQLVLQLIQQILQFPYNISYAHVQNTVYFSCSASDSIFKSDFYDSLFFLTQRFVIQQPLHPLLTVCLNCLKRVLMARISSFDQELKDSFIKKSVVGITRLMNILKNADKSLQIIQLNNKLLGNIPLRKFRKYEQFLLWLPLIEIHLHKNLFYRPFRFDDKQYFQCCSLLQKISLNFVNEKLVEYKQTFEAITQKLFSQLITKLLSQQQPLHLFMDVQNLKQFRQSCDEFFDTIKDFMFYNTVHYTILLSRLQTIIFEKVRNMQQVPVNTLISLNLLVSRLFNSSNLNQITSSLQADQQSTNSLKSIYKNQILFVNQYFKDFRNRYSDIYLQYSTIILLETITTQLCNNISISASDSVEIVSIKSNKKNESYSISNTSKLLNFIEFPVENTQQFMNTLLCYISNYITVEDRKIAIFALDIMNSCLIRVKWSVKRKYFKKLPVVKNMIKFCAMSRTVNSQNKQYLKCRMQMTKLVATVAFDDCLDSYKRQIDTVFSELSTSSILPLIYELRGIVQQIDSSMIYKYFLQKGSVLLIQIMQTVSSTYLQNQQILKNSLKLCQFYFYNLLQRISSKGRTAMLICQLMIQCIPSWQIILNFLLKQLFEQPDKYISSACHLLGVLCKLIQGDYINLLHIHEINNKIDNYLSLLIMFAYKISRSQLLNYQKMKKQMNKFCNCIFNHMNQYIYNMNTSSDIMVYYCGLYSFSLALLFQQIDNQIPYLQKNKDLDTILDFVNNGMRYQYQSLIEVHSNSSNQKAKLFKEYLRSKILQMILTYIKVMVVSNVSAWRVDKLSVFIKESFLVYQENTNQLCLKIMSLYPNSSFQLLQQFTKSCLTSEKPFWYSKFNDWLDSAKGVEQIERMPILVQ